MEKLTGSEKQIKWAEDIRKKFIEEVGNATEEDCKAELEESGDLEDLNYSFVKKTIKTILIQNEASFWIRNRSNMELFDLNMLAETANEEEMKSYFLIK